jgi:ribonuclease D
MQINSKYSLVQDKKSLELAMVHLQGANTLSVDTESSGFYTYYSKICLIQITANSKNFLFDPLSPIDIKLLGNLFKNPNILKIFHSAIDDIKALKRDFGFEFETIADTMYSSKLLGLEHNSLNYLVEFYHKVNLSKTEQKSNWEKRPLDRNQLQYAALDTAYLESIWEKMKEELIKRNLYEEAISEFEKISKEQPANKDLTNEIQWYKFPEIDKYTPQERRSIADILQFRDDKAKRMNKAPFRVINNETIIKIIKRELNEQDLIQQLGKKDGSDLYKILNNPLGDPLDKMEIPKNDYEVKQEEELQFKNLRKWREKIMKKRNMDHTMLPSNKQLLSIIRNSVQSLESLRSLNLMSEWKVNQYGNSIIKALNNENYDDLIQGLVPLNRPKQKKFFTNKKKESKNREEKKDNLDAK